MNDIVWIPKHRPSQEWIDGVRLQVKLTREHPTRHTSFMIGLIETLINYFVEPSKRKDIRGPEDMRIPDQFCIVVERLLDYCQPLVLH